MIKQEITITNAEGLHARPAAVFVKEAAKFKSEIKIETKGKKINAKSITAMLALGVSKGTTITLTAEGEDEKEAVQSLGEILGGNF